MKIFYEQIKEEGLNLESSFSFEEDQDKFDKVSFKGRIDKAGEAYALSGVMEVSFSCPCDRCLEPIGMNFCEQVLQTVSPLGFYPKQSGGGEEGLTDEEAGMFVTPADHFDLNEFLREEALLLIPAKRLCREDCKGICGGCGAMLNNESCRCGEETDFKWSALNKLKR